MSARYFIAPDAYGDIWLWREHGDTPQAALAKRELRDDPAVWDAIVAWVGGQS